MEYDDLLDVESVSLGDLPSSQATVRSSVQSSIAKAFGQKGAGILLVRNLPFTFHVHRQRLLQAGHNLPSIPRSELEQLEFPKIHYSTGWSHGREIFNGVPDVSKGSFYANPIYDDPSQGDPQLIKQYPFNMYPNVWPSSKTIPDLESSFKYLGQFINDTALKIAKQIDILVHNINETKLNGKNTTKEKHKSTDSSFMSLYEILRTSRSAKGRLLHYFPPTPSTSDTTNPSLWCGFHNDHGTLTGLLSAQYFPSVAKRGNDNAGGLYVIPSGESKPRRVVIPPDCLAFQIGEAAQIVTGGILRATPHGVVAPSVPNISRVTLAVFLQPNPWVKLRLPTNTDGNALTSSRIVPALSERFRNNDTFQQFTEATLAKFSTQ